MIEEQQAERTHDVEGDTTVEQTLEAARNMLPGRERNAAIKQAGLLRDATNSYSLIFAAGRSGGD